MLIVVLGALLYVALVDSATFHLEPFHGYIHDGEFAFSQTECLAECSSKNKCCAFSFDLNDVNKCYTYTDCSQQEKPGNDYEKRMYYLKEGTPSVRSVDTTTLPATVDPDFHQLESDDLLALNSDCHNALKTVLTLQEPDKPMLKMAAGQWAWCQACKDHADEYRIEIRTFFTILYTDSKGTYAIMARGSVKECDLVVECNPKKFGRDTLWLNGEKRIGEQYAVRITWNNSTWHSKLDIKPELKMIIPNNIKCQ